MSSRLIKMADDLSDNPQTLKNIFPEDIPASGTERKTVRNIRFDEPAIAAALERLDKLIGLQRVKTAIRNFVQVSRTLQEQGKDMAGRAPLKWSFAGNTGTGKSAVAGIFAEILCAMRLLERGHLVEVKAEEIYGVTMFQAEERLKNAMQQSQQGLLFIDGDAPHFKNSTMTLDSEQLRIKLAGYTAGMPGSYALIIAEHEAPRQFMVKSLAEQGIAEFDHTFIFEDYTEDELLQILTQMLADEELHIDMEATDLLRTYIAGMSRDRTAGYANARTMKLMSHTIADNARLRTGAAPATTVIAKDVEGFVWKGVQKNKYGLEKIGF
jgi:SpoVK/Ycf46/Vps4 family AAA+-type ATPase